MLAIQKCALHCDTFCSEWGLWTIATDSCVLVEGMYLQSVAEHTRRQIPANNALWHIKHTELLILVAYLLVYLCEEVWSFVAHRMPFVSFHGLWLVFLQTVLTVKIFVVDKLLTCYLLLLFCNTVCVWVWQNLYKSVDIICWHFQAVSVIYRWTCGCSTWYGHFSVCTQLNYLLECLKFFAVDFLFSCLGWSRNAVKVCSRPCQLLHIRFIQWCFICS